MMEDDFTYYNASIVSEHVYKMVESGLTGVLDALRDSLQIHSGPSTVQVSRLDVDQKYMVLENMDSIYVAMVGTKSLQDVIVDGQVQRRTIPFSLLEKGAAHAGFFNRSMDIPIHALYHQSCVVKGKRLVVCGHSLGGAVAALSTWRLISEMGALDSVVCITFGSPGVYSGNMRGYERVINFMAEDDPLSLLSRVSVYKHIGKVIMLPKTGAVSVEKHRMSYYRRYITNRFHGIEERYQIQGAVVMPPLEVSTVEGKFANGGATLYLDIIGDYLDFVHRVQIISSSRKYLCRMQKQSAERIIIVFNFAPYEVLSESQNLSVTLFSDFGSSTYPIKIKRPIIWVVYTYIGPSHEFGRRVLMGGAQVWNVANDVDVRHRLELVNVCIGGTLDHIESWLDRIKLTRFAKKAEYPYPDGILVMGKVKEPASVYRSLYTLLGTLRNRHVVLIYNTDTVLQGHVEYKIKTLTGIEKQHITSHSLIENAVRHTVLILAKYDLNSKI